jgi:uncharacterized cupin superfamily protein
MIKTRIGHLGETPTAPAPPWVPGVEKVFREARLSTPLGVTQFGVNHVTLQPGFEPWGNHWHEAEDEFLYVLSGEITLIDDRGEHLLRERDFVGSPAGEPNAHCLANRSAAPATYLVVGARHRGRETVHYPREGVTRSIVRDENGMRVPGASETKSGA